LGISYKNCNNIFSFKWPLSGEQKGYLSVCFNAQRKIFEYPRFYRSSEKGGIRDTKRNLQKLQQTFWMEWKQTI